MKHTVKLMLLLLLLLLGLCLSGCVTVIGDDPLPQDTADTADTADTDDDLLTVEVPETEVWQRRHDDVWSSTPTVVSADFERVSGAAKAGMTVGQELLVLDFMECYYQSVGNLQVIDCAELFTSYEEAEYHRTVWRDLCTIRLLSPLDLHMTSYSFSLRCVSLTPSEETERNVDITLRESSVYYFAGLNGIPTEQLGVEHTFTLRSMGGDRWRIVSHTSDENAYYSADYDRVTHQDNNFPELLTYIKERRELPREGFTAEVTAEHAYDRDAARDYMLTWVGKRNGDYKAYDEVGGNCMNFGSQVLHAGGIPMQGTGYKTGWFYRSKDNVSLAWVNVGYFLDYAAADGDGGLVAVVGAPYFSGETGDIITMGVKEPANHTTVILDTIEDENGQVIDYLLCSNTADLRNFPASAYYYTNRQLTKIIGWNDL